MKKYHLLLVAEETTGKNRSRIVEEIVIGEYSTLEELQGEIDHTTELLELEEVEMEEDE